MTPPDCPRTSCDCGHWCRAATALDVLDPMPARPGAFPAYPTEQP